MPDTGHCGRFDSVCRLYHLNLPKKPKGGTKTMRRYSSFDSLDTVETLEIKVSPTALSVAGLVAAPVVAKFHAVSALDDNGDDPLPDPEPDPPPYPGDDPPIEYPILPPSGPIGPG
jgi:hypothetical protein